MDEEDKKDSIIELEQRLISKIKIIQNRLNTDYYYLIYHGDN